MLAAQFLSICVALLIVMGLARQARRPLVASGSGACSSRIAALFTFVAPYLDFTTDAAEGQGAARGGAPTTSRSSASDDIPLRVEKVSPDTDQANAYAFGLGPSRRVVFWDTILRKPFTKEEQKVVLAHELGAPLAASTCRRASAGSRSSRFRARGSSCGRPAAGAGWATPAAVPLALLVVAVFQLATLPLANHISSRMEAEADWKALEVTRDPAALEGLMVESRQDVARRSRPAAPGAARVRHAPDARRPRRDGAGLGRYAVRADGR